MPPPITSSVVSLPCLDIAALACSVADAAMFQDVAILHNAIFKDPLP
jgi:hypothetical protein